MKKLPALLTIALSFGLTGCPGLKVPLHAPPQYEEGRPSDPFFEKLARRTSEMAPEGDIPSDPEQALLAAHEYLEERGIRVVPKAEGFERWDNFTTTFPRKILVAKDWEEKSVAQRAEILHHEIVHVREYDVHTPLQMGTLYLVAEGRWALEVQAYRESFRVQRLFGVPEDEIRDRMEVVAEALYREYELGSMPHDYAVGMAVGIWMRDSP